MFQVDSGKIHIGRGDIYIGGIVPVTPPVPLTGGVPAEGDGWTFVGATLDGANMTYRPTTVDVYTQQSSVLAVSVVNTVDISVEFTIGELTFENLNAFFLAAGDADPTVTLGGLIFPTSTPLLIVAPKRDGNYVEAMLYKAYFPADRTIHVAREAATAVRITARGLGVFTRALGDQLGFINPAVTSA